MYATFDLNVFLFFFVRTRLGIESADFMRISGRMFFVYMYVYGVEVKGIK